MQQKWQVADEFPCEFGTFRVIPHRPRENSSDLAKRSFLSLPCHFSCVLLVSSSLWVGPSICPLVAHAGGLHPLPGVPVVLKCCC